MKYLILFGFVLLHGCSQSKSIESNFTSNQEKYKNVTSSQEDIDFYELVELKFSDMGFTGSLYIPKYLKKGTPTEENEIFFFEYFDENSDRISGYTISVIKLKSRNTEKLVDKEYIDIMNDQFLGEMKGDLNEIERILPPSMKNVKVVDFESNLIIHDKYFGKRVLYYEDDRLSGTKLEGVTILNFQFITLQNKTKYSININYFGDDKSLSDLVGLFNTIGGSIKFDLKKS
jgi:hypothetical protein